MSNRNSVFLLSKSHHTDSSAITLDVECQESGHLFRQYCGIVQNCFYKLKGFQLSKPLQPIIPKHLQYCEVDKDLCDRCPDVEVCYLPAELERNFLD